MTRAVCLLGSPRPDGNSDVLATRFVAALDTHGAFVKTHTLRDLRFQGYVPGAERHNQEKLGEHLDDLDGVLEDVLNAHIVVLATPIYFCNMSGLLKQAMDRFYEFLDVGPKTLPRRRDANQTLVLIQTQGEGAGQYGNLLDQYAPAFDMLGFSRRELIRACNVREIGDVLNQPEILREADLLARSLVLGEDAEIV